MKKLLLWSLIILGLHSSTKAQSQYNWNESSQVIYNAATSLRIPEARKLIAIEKKNNPNNLTTHLLESYANFYQLFLNENPTDFSQLFPHFNEQIKILEAGPKQSPFYLYSLALVHLHKSVIGFRFNKNWEAALDFRRAYLLLKENKKVFPKFTPNDVYYGFLTTVIATIPKGYSWIANLLGMSGTIVEGNALVLKYLQSNDAYSNYCKNEALFLYPYLLMIFEGNEKKTFEFIQNTPYDLINNHLHAYMATNLFLNHQQSEKAISIMKGIEINENYLTLPFWQLEKGYAFLNQLKIERAQKSFLDFINKFKGSFYIKDAYEKLSWTYYLQGDQKNATFYRNESLKKGSLLTDADKQANDNALNGAWPNTLLLKARLLSDGGYQTQALQILAGKTSNDFSQETDKIEFPYRLGRIYDLSEQPILAIRFYKSAIEKGQNAPAYFAARAALQLGLLYEKKADFEKAITFYNTCLTMKNHAFKNSLDQKAKAGIQRCVK